MAFLFSGFFCLPLIRAVVGSYSEHIQAFMRDSLLFSSFSKREKLAVIGLLIQLAVAIAVFSFWIDRDRAVFIVHYLGLPALWLVMVLVGAAGYSALKANWEGIRASLLKKIEMRGRSLWIVGGVFLLCSLYATTLFPPGNRTQMDEIVILSTSRVIHEEREPLTPLLLDTVNGVNKVSAAYVDKRPFLYATLVALAHDILGYSPGNAFKVNQILGVLTLLLLGGAGWLLGGEAGAVVGMVSLITVPLFAQHVSGGGIDVLNLTLIVALFLVSAATLRSPSTALTSLLIGMGVLLAYARYESIIYMMIPCLVFLINYIRHGRLFIDFTAGLYVAALIPLFSIHFQTFSDVANSFQFDDKGVTSAFSPSFFYNNIGHALSFFLDQEHVLTNSTAVFAIGFVALVALIVGLALKRDWIRRRPDVEALVLVGLVILAGFGLLMFYSWGELDEPIGSRLSLPFYLLLSLALAYFAGRVRQQQRKLYLVGILGVFICSIYGSGIPIGAKNYAGRTYRSGVRIEQLDAFVKAQPDTRFAVINPVTNFWITRNVYSLPPSGLRGNLGFISKVLQSGYFRRVYLIEEWERERTDQPFHRASEKKGRKQHPLDLALDQTLDLEPVGVDAVEDNLLIKYFLVKGVLAPHNAPQ